MYILFDIGGTKTRLAFSVDGKKIEKLKIIKTKQDFKEGIRVFLSSAFEIANGRVIKAVAGGVPGPLDKKRAKLLAAPNLIKWINKPIKKELEKGLNCPVYLENDADMVGLGEAVYGAGKGYDIVVYITVSTGIGGVQVVRGNISPTLYGSEMGHQFLDIDDSIGICAGTNYRFGNLQCISGSEIKKKTGKLPEDINDPEFWKKQAEIFTYGIYNTILHWSPEIVVLGGGIMLNKISLAAVQKKLTKIMKIYPEIPKLKKAKLEDLGGLWGALYYLKNLEK